MTIFLNLLSVIAILGIIPVLYFTFSYKLEYYTGVFFSAVLSIISLGLYIFTENVKNGVRIIDIIIENAMKNISSTFVIFTEALKQQGYATEEINEMSDVLFEYLRVTEQACRLAVPALVVISAVVLCAVLFFIVKWIIMLINRNTTMYPHFSDIRFIKSGTYMFIFSYICSIFVKNPALSAVFVNMTIILGTYAVVSGFSYVDFRLKQKLKYGVVRFIIYILFFFTITPVPFINELVVFILMFIGVMDALVNYRLRYYKMRNIRKE